ncbi:MAG: ABC transporter permease [Acutalibacteraceae bacterium]
MIKFAERNLKIFLRDRAAVFFSLLAVLIVLGLYLLFLGEQLVSNVSELVDGADFLMNSWIFAGVLAVTSVTSTLGSFGVIINDKSKKIYKDLICTPIKPWKLVGGYILSSFCVGMIMSIIVFILSEVFIVINGGELLPLSLAAEVLGTIVVAVLASSAMMYFIVSFFNSQGAFTAASTVIGTLIGFIMGIYLPIGELSEGLQYVIEFFPISHAASLFRKFFMEVPLDRSFSGIPNEFATQFKVQMGIEYKVGDFTFSSLDSLFYLLVTAIVFYILGILITARKRNK